MNAAVTGSLPYTEIRGTDERMQNWINTGLIIGVLVGLATVLRFLWDIGRSLFSLIADLKSNTEATRGIQTELAGLKNSMSNLAHRVEALEKERQHR